jgi:hypothetical protein
MRHHTHLVETGLAIEEYVVTVFQVALNNPAILQEGVCSLVVLEVDSLAGVSNDIASSGIILRACSHQFCKVLNIVAGDW